MELTIIIAGTAVLAALIAWLLTHFISRSRFDRQLYAKDAQLVAKDAELRSVQTLREHEAGVYARTLAELKASQQQALEATKNELALENEKRLKAREESLRKEAEDTMRTLTGGLNKDIKEMKEAFDAQKKAHAEESSAIKTQFEQTVRHLKEQTDAIGTQAGDLANALKGQNKMQGIFGETILENLLQAEGLRPGRDYETEFWLRDKTGNIIRNELTDKKMRPDFALHYPDSTDVIIDAKVSLTALSDYFSADTDAARADAARRNLQSVLTHVQELAGKEYQKYIVGRKTLDYVIMFIPNYGAYQLAKQELDDDGLVFFFCHPGVQDRVQDFFEIVVIEVNHEEVEEVVRKGECGREILVDARGQNVVLGVVLDAAQGPADAVCAERSDL